VDTWLHASYNADTRYTRIWSYGAFLFGPLLLLAILAAWNLVRGRRTSIALRWALVITGILGLLWTGVLWLYAYVISADFRFANSYGPAIAATGFLYAVLAGLFGWVSRPTKPSSARAASAASAAPPLAEERQSRQM